MQEGALNKVNTLYGLPRVDTYIHFFCGAKQIIQVGASFCFTLCAELLVFPTQ